MGIYDIFHETIAIDPGSYALRIVRNGTLAFNERSQIFLDKSGSAITGIGDSLSAGEGDVSIAPVDYAIADFQAFEMLLRGAIRKAGKRTPFYVTSFKMFFGVPTNVTEVEKRAYRDSGEHAGAVEVYMISQNCCAALGMNILLEVRHFILIDFSASKMEIAVFVDSMPISLGVLRMGTQKIFHTVESYLLRQHKIKVSDKEVADIFEMLGKDATRANLRVQYATITPGEIHEVLRPYFTFVNDEIRDTIERVSNQTEVGKALTNGVYFTEGGSAIPYLRQQIELGGRIKSTVSPTPQLDCVNGLLQIMVDKGRFKDYITT